MCPGWGTYGTTNRCGGLVRLDPRCVAAQWDTYFLEPLAVGGAARLTASVQDAVSGALPAAVVCFVGPVAATGAQDTNPALVSMQLSPDPTGGWSASLFGAPRAAGLTVSWFASFGGVWAQGPVVTGVDLSTGSVPSVLWVLDWIVDRLQEFSADHPLAPNRTLVVRRTYPRDTTGWPMLSVQVDQISNAGSLLAESEGAPSPLAGASMVEGRIFQVAFSFIGWSSIPEDRSFITPWLAEAFTLLIGILGYVGLSEPTFNIEESEDFETLGVPAFISTAHLTGQIESRWTRPLRSGYGSISL